MKIPWATSLALAGHGEADKKGFSENVQKLQQKKRRFLCYKNVYKAE